MYPFRAETEGNVAHPERAGYSEWRLEFPFPAPTCDLRPATSDPPYNSSL
jgi:hypothetical protein